MLCSQEPTGSLNTPVLSAKKGSVKFASNHGKFSPYSFIKKRKENLCVLNNKDYPELHIKLSQKGITSELFYTMPSQSIPLSFFKQQLLGDTDN